MKQLLAIIGELTVLAVVAGASAAAPNPSGSGQPSQTCLSSSAPMEPG